MPMMIFLCIDIDERAVARGVAITALMAILSRCQAGSRQLFAVSSCRSSNIDDFVSRFIRSE